MVLESRQGQRRKLEWNAIKTYRETALRRLIFSLCFISFLMAAGNIDAARTPSQNLLKAKITVPYPYSIVRGDVPIYGVACGKGFKEFILEYGEGYSPRKWTLIGRSDNPQSEENSKPKVDFSLDKTIPGNLGMWDTGLTEYRYGEHKANLNVGVYALRLTVKDKKGKTAEDKIILEVGRVILNSIGGQVGSKDNKALLHVSEHSLYSAAEVISLKALDLKTVSLPDRYTLLSKVYEMSPSGLKFTRNAALKIKYDKKNAKEIGRIGIIFFNTVIQKWEYIESYLDEKENYLVAYLNSTPDKFSVYAIAEGEDIKNRRGNFAPDVTNESFDAQEYPVISFDYKIPPGIKINLLVKVNGKWFDVVFTDDEKIYWDINMQKAGNIPDVKADNQWHHAEFNLYNMLKKLTGSFIIEEMELADWDCTGFMKLEFGHNRKDSSFYIDNFMIKKWCSSSEEYPKGNLSNILPPFRLLDYYNNNHKSTRE